MTLADLIKPLVWFEVEKSRLGGKYKSDGYTIRYIEGFWLMDFAGEGKLSWRFPSLDAAKAAAQANYTARILSALDPDAIAKIRADALREAAEAVRGVPLFGNTARQHHIALEQYCLCRDAILALIEKENSYENL